MCHLLTISERYLKHMKNRKQTVCAEEVRNYGEYPIAFT